jgi:hypothetical protein
MIAGCPEWHVHALRKRHGWPDQNCWFSEPPPPSVDDARISEDSLRLSPWVQQRADEIRAQRLKERAEESVNATQQRVYRQAR